MVSFIFGLLCHAAISPAPIFAQEGPLNNKFGIHIAKPHDEDIEDAARLVNSNGGAWGYVTKVMQEDDRDVGAWQARMDKMRELRLIPIVRLATRPEGANWRRPLASEAEEWADFLNSLRWVTRDRYVILFNEPNHATEWGGAVDPEDYADVAKAFAEALKKRNSNFKIMLAGLDAAAPSLPPRFEDSGVFLRRVVERFGIEDVNRLVDIHSSHSYPNPGFSGPPNAVGKGTVRSYEWELRLLSSLGVKEMPVFITETGWNADAVGRERAAQYYTSAFQDVWLPDDRVRAVTPFILNYQGEPFLSFSWRKYQSREFYPQYYAIQNFNKVVGAPPVLEGGRIQIDSLPSELVEDSSYHFIISLWNTGEGFWDEGHGYRLELSGTDPREYLKSNLFRIRPGEGAALDFYFKTGKPSAAQERRFILFRGDEKVLESNVWRYKVLALPSLKVQSKFFPKMNTTSDRFELQIFDEHEDLVFKRSKIRVKNGEGVVEGIRNIAYGKTYRVVMLHKGYLPRQTYVTFSKGTNEIIFERMLPFDLNGDGKLSFADIWRGMTTPHELKALMP